MDQDATQLKHGSKNISLVTPVIVSLIVGALAGFGGGALINPPADAPAWVWTLRQQALGFSGQPETESGSAAAVTVVKEESAVVSAVEQAAPAVVSIIISKDLPKIIQYYDNPSTGDPFFDDFFNFGRPRYRQEGTEKQEVGGGSGFIVSADGYIVTNKHVVVDEGAEYTVLTNGEERYPAQVLARDPANDIAILKIDAQDLPTLPLGDSAQIKIGQSVIAIGNALGEFRNTVSSGIISGLARSITAGGADLGSEQLFNVIQTDAAINPGNSGGPLLNLVGQVIGVNTAIAGGAENIGFAIPVNEIKPAIESVKQYGKIVRPMLGVRYVQISEALTKEQQLPVDYGALIVRGDTATDLAVVPGSPADRAGLVENDIILEVNGTKLDSRNPLFKVISTYQPGEQVTLKILHRGEEKTITVTLEESKL